MSSDPNGTYSETIESKLFRFNNQYLNHLFILHEDQKWIGLNIFCQKCKAQCFYYTLREKYRMKSPGQVEDLILTCDEMIIKNIIE